MSCFLAQSTVRNVFSLIAISTLLAACSRNESESRVLRESGSRNGRGAKKLTFLCKTFPSNENFLILNPKASEFREVITEKFKFSLRIKGMTILSAELEDVATGDSVKMEKVDNRTVTATLGTDENIAEPLSKTSMEDNVHHIILESSSGDSADLTYMDESIFMKLTTDEGTVTEIRC